MKRRRYPQHSQRFKWAHKHFGWFLRLSKPRKFLLISLVGLGILVVTAVITTIVFASSLSSKDSIMNRNKTGLTLYDRNGQLLYQFYNATNSNHAKLADISTDAKEALVAAEDEGFYDHPGFSIMSILGAIWENIRPGGLDSGGSTITQQLVKNALLTEDRHLLRKYQEIVLAIEIERRYSKDEILEMYLNSIYFGEGTFGIEDAAKAYFGKSAKDLDLAQSSMLIGIVPAPNAYSPVTGNPEYAKQRQAYVLRQMVKNSFATQAEADAATGEQLTYAPVQERTYKAPHFALMVKQELEDEYGEEVIARSGYKVTTSLDLSAQEKAETIVGNQVGKLSASKVSNGSAVVMDPKNGEILALVGSKDWNNTDFGKVNMATATRQPGSSFKPLVYATGIENRELTAATIFHDKKTDFGGGYTPFNYDRKFRGDVTLRRSLANSLNVPAVEAMQTVGIQNVINTAKKMGITTLDKSPTEYGLPLALGSGQAKLLEMTNAYGTFANGGKKNEVASILAIRDKNDKEIFKKTAKTSTAISEQTAFIISSILSDNAARSEVFGNSLTLSRGRLAAVKTGTTEDYRDAWTIGYTPSLVIGVWIGNNDNTPMNSVAGSSGSGPIWRQLMQDILGSAGNEQFKQPSGIVSQLICRNDGALAVNPGDNTYTEFFRASTLPTKKCNEKTPEPDPAPVPETTKPEEPETTDPDTETDPEGNGTGSGTGTGTDSGNNGTGTNNGNSSGNGSGTTTPTNPVTPIINP